MLKLLIDSFDVWDDNSQEFITYDKKTICLEHSLLSVSKWESIYKKPFLNESEKSPQEVIDYFKCMLIDESDSVYLNNISDKDVQKIQEYIEDPMTASWVSGDTSRDRSVITSELIYYWMVSAQIPFETERWHLNRLLMLIRIFGEKTNPSRKKSRAQIIEEQRRLNNERRAKLGTNG